MNVLDTNVWLYCHDTRDPRKQEVAQRLVRTATPMGLLWQIGCEFVAAARKLEPYGFTQDQAWDALADMQALADAVLLPKPEIWQEARALQKQHQLHFWDALIIASCVHENVSVLYTEDITAHDEIDGLKVVNPFAT